MKNTGITYTSAERSPVDVYKRQGQHSQDQFGIAHVVPQVFLFQPLEILVLPRKIRRAARFAHGVVPVSYTHLDVYKRQGIQRETVCVQRRCKLHVLFLRG